MSAARAPQSVPQANDTLSASLTSQAGLGHAAAGHRPSTRRGQVCFHQEGGWDQRPEEQVGEAHLRFTGVLKQHGDKEHV